MFKLLTRFRRVLRSVAAFLLFIPSPGPGVDVPERQPVVLCDRRKRVTKERWWKKARCFIHPVKHADAGGLGAGYYAVYRKKADYLVGKKPWRKIKTKNGLKTFLLSKKLIDLADVPAKL